MATTRLTLVGIALVLALTLALSGCSSPPLPTPRTLTIGSVNGTAGAVIQEWVTLNNVTSVGGYHLVLTYNAANLNLISLKPGPDVPPTSTFTVNPSAAGTIDVIVTGGTQFINSPSQRVLNIIFEFAAPSPVSTVNPITWSSGTLTNLSSLPVPFVITVAGSITTV